MHTFQFHSTKIPSQRHTMYVRKTTVKIYNETKDLIVEGMAVQNLIDQDCKIAGQKAAVANAVAELKKRGYVKKHCEQIWQSFLGHSRAARRLTTGISSS